MRILCLQKTSPFRSLQTVKQHSVESKLGTEGYSGADIKFLVREIILNSIDFDHPEENPQQVPLGSCRHM